MLAPWDPDAAAVVGELAKLLRAPRPAEQQEHRLTAEQHAGEQAEPPAVRERVSQGHPGHRKATDAHGDACPSTATARTIA